MPAIDHEALRKVMDLAQITPTQLSKELHVSLTYVGDITSGRRTLKRSPELRSKIAKAVNVPIHWIERPTPESPPPPSPTASTGQHMRNFHAGSAR